MNHFYNLAIIVLFFTSCKGHSGEESNKHTAERPHETHGVSLIDDNIDRLRKRVDSLAAAKDVYAQRDIINKGNEIIGESDQTFDYITRWQNRIERDAKGKMLPGDDTISVQTILVKGGGGDSLEHYIRALRDVYYTQFRDTNGFCTQIPLTLELKKDRPQTNWKVNMFQGLNVNEANDVFDQLKYDTRCSELVMLNKLFTAYTQKRKR